MDIKHSINDKTKDSTKESTPEKETSTVENITHTPPKEVNQQQKQDPEKSKDTIPTSQPTTTAQTDSSTGQPQTESSGGWGWGWGNTIGSLLSSSVSAVSESAQSLGKGIESMVTNVEDALGVPQPTEMVRDPPPSPSNNGDGESKEEDESGIQ